MSFLNKLTSAEPFTPVRNELEQAINEIQPEVAALHDKFKSCNTEFKDLKEKLSKTLVEYESRIHKGVDPEIIASEGIHRDTKDSVDNTVDLEVPSAFKTSSS